MIADSIVLDMSGVSVVLCAYTEDRCNDLEAAIGSLQCQHVPPHEIIVVIGHNSVLLQLSTANLTGIIVVENTETPGLSGARNCGIRIAQCDIIAFMDDDAIAAPDWLERLIAHYANPQVWGVGGAIELLWLSGKPTWFPEEFSWLVGCTYRGLSDATRPIRNLIGCIMSFRNIVFDQIAGFQSGIGRISTHPLGCDEPGLYIHLRQRWLESILLYEPGAQVLHRVPIARANWRYIQERCSSEGLSKAAISQRLGSKAGLVSERTYMLRTLPHGVARGLADTLFRRQPAGLLRACAIVIGLGLTLAGYLTGTLTERFSTGHPAAEPSLT